MKKSAIVIALIVFVSCNGGNSSGSLGGTSDSVPAFDKGGGDTSVSSPGRKIDTSAAALPTDTATYQRKPGDTVIRP